MRQPGYKQVSVTPDAHRALKQLKWAFSDTLGQEITLSDVIRILQKLYAQQIDDDTLIEVAGQAGIEPPLTR